MMNQFKLIEILKRFQLLVRPTSRLAVAIRKIQEIDSKNEPKSNLAVALRNDSPDVINHPGHLLV